MRLPRLTLSWGNETLGGSFRSSTQGFAFLFESIAGDAVRSSGVLAVCSRGRGGNYDWPTGTGAGIFSLLPTASSTEGISS
jgi:hypothetical protein